jgi:hypothetical protein
MKLQESVFQKAEQTAAKTAKDAVGRVQDLRGLPQDAGECLAQAKKSANEVKSDLVSYRDKLKPAAKNLVSAIEDRLDSLAEQAKEAAEEVSENPGRTFSNAGRQLANEALSEGITNAREAAAGRIRKELSRTASKAVFGAMDVIVNRQGALYRGIMGILVQRELRDLRKLERKARDVNRKMTDIARAVQLIRGLKDAIEGEDHGPLSQAVWRLEYALRNLRNAREAYKQRGDVPEVSTDTAARSLRRAGRILSSSPVVENITAGLRNIDWSSGESIKDSAAREGNRRKRKVRRAQKTIEDAWSAIKGLPADILEMGKLYGQCVSWAKLALALPDTLDAVNSMAYLIKAGERLRYLVRETEVLKRQVEVLGEEAHPEVRSQHANRARNLALEVEALQELTGDPNRRSRDWYQNAVELFNSSFLQGGALDVLKNVELQVDLIDGAAAIVEQGEEVQAGLGASRSALRRISSARYRAQVISRRFENKNGAVDLVKELLERAGVSNPINTIVLGKLPGAVKMAISGGALAIPEDVSLDDLSDVSLPSVSVPDTGEIKNTISEKLSTDEASCGEIAPTTGADKEALRVAEIDDAREKKQALTGPVQAMKGSDDQMKVDIMRYAV